jgi:drug/metabolite transporter (DMT)-like permease
VLILDERPSTLQLAGVMVVLAGICVATVTLPRRRALAVAGLDAEVSGH